MSYSLYGNGDGTITVVDEKNDIRCTHNSLNESLDCNNCGEYSEARRNSHAAIGVAAIFAMAVVMAGGLYLLLG